jgi:hypothetical protein
VKRASKRRHGDPESGRWCEPRTHAGVEWASKPPGERVSRVVLAGDATVIMAKSIAFLAVLE